MNRKEFFYWLAQIGGWGAYYVLSATLYFTANDIKFTYNVVVWVFASFLVSILLSHLIRYLILNWKWVTLKLEKVSIFALFSAMIAAIVLEGIQYGLDYWYPIQDTPHSINFFEPAQLLNFIFGVTRSLILFLLWIGLYYGFIIFEKSRKSEISNLQFQASKNEIELKNLMAQLNPHFLFNSLNSIRALVGLDPEQAKSSITRLSSLLRQSVHLGKQDVISLKKELELVENYLELEKIRFEERLNVELEVAENSLKCEIPPLMLQTIVENAIKHGISQSIEGGSIVITTTYKNHELFLEVKNTGKLEGEIESKGVGIANTKKRLEILYGDNAGFSIRQENDFVIVTVKISDI